jgi:hypothetical protein
MCDLPEFTNLAPMALSTIYILHMMGLQLANNSSLHLALSTKIKEHYYEQTESEKGQC